MGALLAQPSKPMLADRVGMSGGRRRGRAEILDARLYVSIGTCCALWTASRGDIVGTELGVCARVSLLRPPKGESESAPVSSLMLSLASFLIKSSIANSTCRKASSERSSPGSPVSSEGVSSEEKSGRRTLLVLARGCWGAARAIASEQGRGLERSVLVHHSPAYEMASRGQELLAKAQKKESSGGGFSSFFGGGSAARLEEARDLYVSAGSALCVPLLPCDALLTARVQQGR